MAALVYDKLHVSLSHAYAFFDPVVLPLYCMRQAINIIFAVGGEWEVVFDLSNGTILMILNDPNLQRKQ